MKNRFPKLSVIQLFFVLLLHVTVDYSAVANETAADTINIALIATPSTSFVSGWESLAAVNDGFTPSNSNDKTKTAYGNWNNPNSFQWVQYDWNQVFIATSAEIYWFDDNGGVLTPNEAYIENYDKNSSSWVRIAAVPCIKNQFNKVVFGSIQTSRMRVIMKNTKQSTGILEFRVWGKTLSGSTDIQAPSAPGKPEIVDMNSTSLTIKWTDATDNNKVTAYNILIDDTIFKVAPYHMYTLKDLKPNSHFMLSLQAIDAAGNLSKKTDGIWIFFGDQENASQPYKWPSYTPTLNYNFRDEFPALAMPTKDLNDCPQVVGTQSSGWWTFKWGPKKKSVVTEKSITPMLERFNKDFAYFRDTMGWPPDRRAKEGYRSAIYLFGSGLSCIDNADSTELGGWQSGINGYACVLASYYPVYSFDPACPYGDKEGQMGAMIHEGIHAVLADLPGAKQAAWFHEGGNTWLQQEAAARQSNDFSSMGFLNACPYIAPFMPIECYTGWLQDGSFGGPSAEGVNMFNGSQQICTWRKLLGGNQYGNTFPTFLGQALGKGSVAWIWRYCPDRVLEGMSKGLGDMQIRRLIMEYRAKQALIDMNEWSGAIKKLLDANFNSTITAEWKPSWIECTPWKATPYTKTWMRDEANKILTPEPRTTPGWSGANQIPLKAAGNEVAVNFIPMGENMTCQLCYRATDGTPVYSQPVSSGVCRLKLDKVPANNVVIAVICNTDYVFEGETTRKAHFDYRLQLVEGLSKASVYKKWYDYKTPIMDVADPVEPFPTEGPLYGTTTGLHPVKISDGDQQFSNKVFPNPLSSEDVIKIEFNNKLTGSKEVKIVDARGTLLYMKKNLTDNKLEIPIEGKLKQGIYFVAIQSENSSETQKIVIQ